MGSCHQQKRVKERKLNEKTTYLIHTNNDLSHHSDENAPPKKLKKKKKISLTTEHVLKEFKRESQQGDYDKRLLDDHHKDGEKVQRTQSFIILPISSEFIIFPDKK